ncbi:hypothetical protein AC249_AIPGENE24563 [Exaiptasia diaphana]|nr:hypothetical protein AC249_AIPGENE24563 [Exaiptasia diaphana]
MTMLSKLTFSEEHLARASFICRHPRLDQSDMDIRQAVKLIESEGRTEWKEIIEELPGVLRASRYLAHIQHDAKEPACFYPERMYVVNALILGKPVKGHEFSKLRRYTTWEGKLKEYPAPYLINGKIDFMLETFWGEYRLYDPVNAMAKFLCHFMEIHPFGDGNGRTAKLFLWLALRMLLPDIKLTHYPKYENWCTWLMNWRGPWGSFHRIYKWIGRLAPKAFLPWARMPKNIDPSWIRQPYHPNPRWLEVDREAETESSTTESSTPDSDSDFDFD